MTQVQICNFKQGLIVACAILGMSASSVLFGDTSMKPDVLACSDVFSYALQLFPQSPEELRARVAQAQSHAQAKLDRLIAIPVQDRTFANTIQAYDELVEISTCALLSSIVHLTSMTHPDQEMRKASTELEVALGAWWVDLFSTNIALYRAVRDYADGNAKNEALSDEQRYYLDSLLEGFEHCGLALPADQLEQVRVLSKEINALCTAFQTAIAADQPEIYVTDDELRGMSDAWKNGLRRTEDGKYIIGVDYPTMIAVMERCEVSATRRQLYYASNHRAYPANHDRLRDIIQKRHEVANIIGYPSFAHLTLSSCMAKTPDTVNQFLRELSERVRPKERAEIHSWMQELPEGIELAANGQLYPWDVAYVKACYKRKHYSIDESVIAEYFPMEHVLKGLLDIYRDFFHVSFVEVPVSGLWHEDVRAVCVKDQDTDEVLGYALLDLHPRPFKYTHACEGKIIPGMTKADGTKLPAVVIVIANFAKATSPDQPALWHRQQAVETFFHEFGHALHDMLSHTKLAGCSGTSVMRDFVELPSQMLESWLTDHSILKQISSHYVTKQPLPDDLIARIQSLETFDSGTFVQRQIMLALLSLRFFDNSIQGEPDEIFEAVLKMHPRYVSSDVPSRFYASFGHLTGYGPRYYGYLWSQVYAADLFETIKPYGLRNPEIGKRYASTVLAPGGSRDPQELLRNFLGRDATQTAFLKNIGVDSGEQK